MGNKKKRPGMELAYTRHCSFCWGKFEEGEQVVLAFGWDRLEHAECAGMSLGQLNTTLSEIAELAGDDS